jgi:hypothetical protein
VIANLTGTERAQDVILKDRCRRPWALDRDFELLWSFKGTPGHFQWPADVDSDGRDEIMAGYALLGHDGTKLWSCHGIEDHADCIWVGNVEQRPDGVPQIVVGGSVTGMYDADGDERWRYEGSVESQHGAIGRFTAGSEALQVAGLDRVRRGRANGKDALFLLSADGTELWKEDRQTRGWLTIINTISGWDGAGTDRIIACRRGGGVLPALYDGSMERVVTCPLNGTVVYGDLLGRGRQDVVYTDETAHVFSTLPGTCRRASLRGLGRRSGDSAARRSTPAATTPKHEVTETVAPGSGDPTRSPTVANGRAPQSENGSALPAPRALP